MFLRRLQNRSSKGNKMLEGRKVNIQRVKSEMILQEKNLTNKKIKFSTLQNAPKVIKLMRKQKQKPTKQQQQKNSREKNNSEEIVVNITALPLGSVFKREPSPRGHIAHDLSAL